MELPAICQKAPYIIDVVAGQKYWWCSCGLSKNQPHCDGAHKGNAFGLKSVMFEAAETGRISLCGCKHSMDKPYCDGSHSVL